MITLYTIGFAEKSAEKFFSLLREAGVKRIIDTRLSPDSQLSGFAKAKDLKFFARELCGIGYEHRIDFAPTKELLNQIRSREITWPEYERQYIKLLKDRKIDPKAELERLNECCLLCSEHNPQQCHRRLLAEYLSQGEEVEIIHLM
jgi:uncharacterized protein (DUF488 family)